MNRDLAGVGGENESGDRGSGDSSGTGSVVEEEGKLKSTTGIGGSLSPDSRREEESSYNAPSYTNVPMETKS